MNKLRGIEFIIQKELSFLHQNLNCYLNYWPADAGSSSSSLLHVASHLYSLPAAYSALFNEAPEEELLKLWGGPWEYKSPEELRGILNKGMTEILSHKFLSANEEILIPSPFGDPLHPQEHLVNLITHMYHHRGQMHLLMKQVGAEVDTGTVYMISEGQWRTD